MSCPNDKRHGCTCSECAAALVAGERSRLPSPATPRALRRSSPGGAPSASPASVSPGPVPAWVSRHPEVLEHFLNLRKEPSR
jgi:hypothetical protein